MGRRGDRSAGMGGTATVIPKQAKQVDLAKDFLKFAKASKEGNIKLWTVLGFDPLRWDVWDSDELKTKSIYRILSKRTTHLFRAS